MIVASDKWLMMMFSVKIVSIQVMWMFHFGEYDVVVTVDMTDDDDW